MEDVDQMMNQDPWLQARGQIESSGNQDSVSGAGAVGMFQITPIALKNIIVNMILNILGIKLKKILLLMLMYLMV